MISEQFTVLKYLKQVYTVAGECTVRRGLEWPHSAAWKQETYSWMKPVT